MAELKRIEVELSLENSNEEIEKMYDEIISNKELLSELEKIGITSKDVIKDNVVKINDYLEDLKYCKNCKGVKNCKKSTRLLNTRLTYENGIVERQLEPCKFILDDLKVENLFYFKDFDDEIDSTILDNVDMNKIKKTIFQSFLKAMQKKDGKWFYITGSPRTGRTYFGIVLAYSAINRGKTVSFINSSFRFKELSDLSMINKTKFDSMIKTLTECDILFIDDFGNEYKNDYIRDGILFQILYSRSNKHLVTVFTSDFSIDEVVTLYSLNKAGTIRAKQIGNLIKSNIDEEFNFGEISIY